MCTGTKWHSSAPPTETGCHCKLDWQLQPWFFHGQNLQCQVSYKRDSEAQRVGRNSPNLFLQLLIHSTEQCLVSTCVCPLQVRLVPSPRTAPGCSRQCRFSRTPSQLITVGRQRCSSFVQTSIKTVVESSLWQLLQLFTSKKKNL